jgi:antitoxin VapB
MKNPALPTRVFRNGNSLAVRIPAELAASAPEGDYEIERVGDELRIRPAARRIGNVLGALARFSPDFMSKGRGAQEQAEREPL